MNFTREPLVETVITPKEGYKLVVKSSKGHGQEEFFVDAIEVISFGKTCFFRSLEKPKCFLVPASDYEIQEVREPRLVLKTSGGEKGIKIGGGRDTAIKAAKEKEEVEVEISSEGEAQTQIPAPTAEQRGDKRRDRKRNRKRRGKHEEDETPESDVSVSEAPIAPEAEVKEVKRVERPALIPPPSVLISETLARYKPVIEAQAPLLEEPEEVVEPARETDKDEEIPFE